MRSFPSVLALALALVTACTAEKTVVLEPVEGSSTRGSVRLHEAITKAFTIRVDAYVEVDALTPEMRALVRRGGCKTQGEVVEPVWVHESGVGGAADVVLSEGKLGDLAGCSVHVYAGEPDASARLACGEL